MRPPLTAQIEALHDAVHDLKPEASRPDLLFRLDDIESRLSALRDAIEGETRESIAAITARTGSWRRDRSHG